MSKRKLAAVIEQRIDAIRLANGLDERQADWDRLDELYSRLEHVQREIAREEREGREKRYKHIRGILAYRARMQMA